MGEKDNPNVWLNENNGIISLDVEFLIGKYKNEVIFSCKSPCDLYFDLCWW